METAKIEQLYQKIAEKINDMIPSEWMRVTLYAEILDDSREVYFFFNTQEDEEYIYSHDIPENFQVSNRIYKNMLLDLQDLFDELRDEFKKQSSDIWTNLTLNLERNGEFSIDYDYEDVLASKYTDTERQVIWEYKHLGITPMSESSRKFLEQYLNEQSDN
ncbi:MULTISPECIES: antitoxin YezG family protein [Bacillus]|uniref:antitoxin YezG family protein n=1 Tax=Bacillus TaxID=1386 RepID=UPI001389FA64|nr:antitoxin YezG family protein [Bacillus halotolerans]KAF1677295.1 hypothetical protein BTW01_17590 [Bacillus sp. SKDU12]